ncbi:heparinase II/III family protein [Phenylobacterium sp.]|uniref:heparinase II/III family protein n=1 Tax=Phenylobacterium sp. TaxID=1871053 RepID=UPI001214DA7B|nr:heparinase II/III family protein [Phenylobacterium sp.]THD57900.1 MAG: heparinase [Phenylobacterium sp.]
MSAPAPGRLLDRLPGGYQLYAAWLGALRRPGIEWRVSPLNQWRLSHPAPEGLGGRPRDLRPADAEAGRRILAGGFVFGGETLALGPRGDPWDRPSPSRRFAGALHGFGWVRDLLAHGEAGAWEALRLTLGWRRLFGRWNGFSWSPPVLERRVFNLACGLAAISGPASDAEADQIAADLARQARFLLELPGDPARAAERAAVAGVAGAALAGAAGEGLLDRALGELPRRLEAAIADGGHATRSPQAALELLFDLMTLDDVLSQLGLATPDEMLRALDRLAGAVRFFTLDDGRLGAFQGGEPVAGPYVAAARAEDAAAPHAPVPPACNGYHRLEAHALQVMVDAASPALGPWSLAACGQPLAIEVLAAGKRLFVGSGWSPQAAGTPALRLVDAASTASVAEADCGAPLSGFAARVLGPRLRDPYAIADVRRQDTPAGAWLDASHDAWARSLGLRHERRLYLDRAADELRGEDALVPRRRAGGAEGRRFVAFVVRFHLHPQVSALMARDRKSVLLKVEGQEAGWWLRSDALEVMLQPSTHHEDGLTRHGQQIVLRGQARLDGGAKLRWKLSAAHEPAIAAHVDEQVA